MNYMVKTIFVVLQSPSGLWMSYQSFRGLICLCRTLTWGGGGGQGIDSITDGYILFHTALTLICP